MPDFNIRVVVDSGEARRGVGEVRRELKTTEAAAGQLRRAVTAAFAAFSFGSSLTGFAQTQTALIGVGRTADLSDRQLQDFGKTIARLSRTDLPFAKTELLGIAQAAGQLGVTGANNLQNFSETIAKLGVASDLQGDAAATALVRILNVAGEGVENVDELASVVVRLGNNMAATESEIVRVANEVARATAVFGVSSDEAAGLGAALRSVGVQAELGGSAVGRAFQTIDASIRKGGADLKTLTQLTGLTGNELRRVFRDDATEAFRLFVEGLGRAAEGGQSAAEILDSLGLSGQEILKVLPVLAQNSELLGEALTLSGDEFERNTALNEEFARGAQSVASQTQLFTNTVRDLVDELGEALAPAFLDAINGIRGFVNAAIEGGEVATIFDGVGAAAGVLIDVMSFLAANFEIVTVAASVLIARQIALQVGAVSLTGAFATLRGGLAAAALSIQLVGVRATAATVGLGALRGAAAGLLAIMGGPVGLIATVGLLAVAFGTTTAVAAQTAERAVDRLNTRIEELGSSIEAVQELNRREALFALSDTEADLRGANAELQEQTRQLDARLSVISRLQGQFVPLVRRYRELAAAGGDTNAVIDEIVDRLSVTAQTSTRARSALRLLERSLIEVGATEDEIDTLQGRVRLLQDAINGVVSSASAARNAIVAMADAEFSISGAGGGGSDDDRPPPRITLPPGGGGGAGRERTFSDVLSELQREIDLSRLIGVEREKLAAVLSAEDDLRRSLTETQRAQIESLIEEQQAIEDRRAAGDFIESLRTENSLLGMNTESRSVRRAQLELESQLSRDLTDSEAALVEMYVRENEELQRMQSLRESLLGQGENLLVEQDLLRQMFEEGTLSAEAFNEQMILNNAAIAEFRIALGEGTLADGFIAELTRMTTAGRQFTSSVGREFATFVGNFSRGFGDAIGAALTGTRDFGDALRDVARSAISQLISSIVQLGIQWALSQALGATVGAAATAASIGQAAALASAWAPAAAFASLATLGSNAVPANAAIIGTVSLSETIGAISSAFADGGYVQGPGGPRSDSILARLSNGEFVNNAASTQRNRAALEYANAGGTVVPAGASTMSNGGFSLTFIDQTGAGVEVTPQYVTRDEAVIIARDIVRADAPQRVSEDVRRSNSAMSKAIGRSTTARPQRD